MLLRSILSVLTTSARSLDVSDINLPLQLSDIPEAIANWHNQMETHVVYERLYSLFYFTVYFTYYYKKCEILGKHW